MNVDAGFQPFRVVVAVPTIAVRADMLDPLEARWRHHTCEPIQVIFSDKPGSWAAGLNDIWQQVADDPPDIFVCGSDDMIPADDNWLPPLVHQIRLGRLPAPCVVDPRFTNHGGYPEPVPDGTPAGMSSFPVIAGEWGPLVFPLPEDLHYYSDNLIAVKLAEAGIPCVSCCTSTITHLWAREGRGAGEGTEEARMLVDTVRYTAALAELGIDRSTLPPGLKGPLAG